MQPVFGELLDTFFRGMVRESNIRPFQVVEIGAGRADLEMSLKRWHYRGIDFVPGQAEAPQLPSAIAGVVLAHEFFDALPVRLLKRTADSWIELRVSMSEPGKLGFVHFDASRELLEYAARYGDPIPVDGWLEVSEGLPEWCRRISHSLSSGYLLVFDYGYEPRELLRFPLGSLVAYHRQHLENDVLIRPGQQDITAHVNFHYLRTAAHNEGLELVSKMTLGAWALSVWPERIFTRRWRWASTEWRLKWKQLVLGMGESFHVLLFRKTEVQSSSTPRSAYEVAGK
jgi:SAM-dependent MidA family methyltransferase